MENEKVKKELFHSVKYCTDALTALMMAVEAMGWTDDLMVYVEELVEEKEDEEEEKMREENADGQS